MSSKKISIETWQKVKDLLPKEDCANKSLIDLVSEISQEFIKEKLNYVYHLRLNYGDKIIDKGKFFNDNYEILENDFGKTFNDFKNDVLYSDDPLGIVLSNHIEVYTENKSTSDKGKTYLTYTLPLNYLHPGDLFGVFGTLDKLSGIPASKMNRDWYARAGTVSFGLAFPFHNDLEQTKLTCRDKYVHLSGNNAKVEKTPGDNKVEFIIEHLKNWGTDIIYIPKHYLSNISKSNKGKILEILYKIGWEQSAPLRYSLFEDTTIYNLILNSNLKINHDRHSLWLFYNFIFKAYRGEAILLKPLVDKKHVICKALDQFLQSNEKYFNLSSSFLPLPFTYSCLNKKNDWGIVSFNHLPIIFNYSNISLNAVLNDFNTINNLIKQNLGSPDCNRYFLPEISGFGNTGGQDDIKVSKTDEIKKRLSEAFGISKEEINLSSREFSNLLLINN